MRRKAKSSASCCDRLTLGAPKGDVVKQQHHIIRTGFDGRQSVVRHLLVGKHDHQRVVWTVDIAPDLHRPVVGPRNGRTDIVRGHLLLELFDSGGTLVRVRDPDLDKRTQFSQF